MNTAGQRADWLEEVEATVAKLIREGADASKQQETVDWFKKKFGVTVIQRDDRSIVMTWSTYEALTAREAGLATGSNAPAIVELCFD